MLSSEHFTEEWFWVLAYCVSAPIVVIVNLLTVCSIGKNSFLLRADAHRLFLLLALRNAVRAAFALLVLFATRWSHTTTKRKLLQGVADVNASTKIGHPVLCDILCTADTFLLALPLYVLVAMAVHFFTRYPSPQLERVLHPKIGSSSSKRYYVSSLKQQEQQSGIHSSSCSSSLWANILLLLLPLVMSALLALPKPLLHLTHTLRPVPPHQSSSSDICTDNSQHLTYDVTVFMLGYLLPVVLVFFLGTGLAIRRCLHCSSKHCCNSWCKEEAVLAQLFVLVALTQLLTFVPTFEAFSGKLDLDLQLGDLFVARPEVARGVETVLGGLALPLLLYTWMPTYRAFASEPDSDDVRLSKPRKVEMRKFEVANERGQITSHPGAQ